MKLQEYISGLDSERLIITKAIEQNLNKEIDLERSPLPINLERASNIMYLRGVNDALVIGTIKGKPCFISFATPTFFKNHPNLLYTPGTRGAPE